MGNDLIEIHTDGSCKGTDGHTKYLGIFKQNFFGHGQHFSYANMEHAKTAWLGYGMKGWNAFIETIKPPIFKINPGYLVKTIQSEFLFLNPVFYKRYKRSHLLKKIEVLDFPRFYKT